MKISPFKIEEWMNRYEAGALYDLTATCIKPLTVCELLEISSKTGSSYTESELHKMLNTPLDYGDITGSERLKNNIKSLYTTQETSNITITHGAIGANQLIFYSLLEKGDEVVCIVPTYQQHYSIPESIGAEVKLYFLKEENNWLPDIEELSKIVTSKTKLLCLNNPNNPTGSVIPNWLIEELVEFAKKNNVWILSDEVYRGLNLIGNPYSISIADIYEKGISVGSMSKTYSLPGLRLGWVCAREDLINEINHQRQYNTISVGVLDDYFASIALENRNAIQERNFNIMQLGIKTFSEWLTKEPLAECIIPNGGTTALVKYKKDMPSRKLCKIFQNRTGVALLPGETMEMEGYVRIGFCAVALKPALDLFSDFLHQ